MRVLSSLILWIIARRGSGPGAVDRLRARRRARRRQARIQRMTGR